MKRNTPLLKILTSFAGLLAFLPGFVNATEGVYPKVEIAEKELVELMEELVLTETFRNYLNVETLNQTAADIFKRFQDFGYSPEYQDFEVQGTIFKNVIASIGPPSAPRLIIGAHYDVYGNQPGADDNASGVAGLIMVAKLLKSFESSLKKRVDFVAYSLEEPPFFRTEHMGSFFHAKSLHDQQVEVAGMVVLEMIGYYSDEPNSQHYPVGFMKWFYPSEGNFIAVISNLSSSSLRGEFKAFMQRASIDVQSLAVPKALFGVDLSDHRNYWHFGYPAIMITDTSFYRNHHYHQKTDTIDTLDFSKMKEAIRGVFFGVLNLARK